MTQEMKPDIKKQIAGVTQQLLGEKTPEQIKADIDRGKWPFAVSEEQMRKDLERWDRENQG